MIKQTMKIINVNTGEILSVSLSWILKEINRDRSEDWKNYDENDWREGLKEFTEFKLLEDLK